MKRAIEWIDTVKGNGFGMILPSELLDLVLAVRSEALDAAELLVRKRIVVQGSPDIRALLEQIAEDIALLGRKSR